MQLAAYNHREIVLLCLDVSAVFGAAQTVKADAWKTFKARHDTVANSYARRSVQN